MAYSLWVLGGVVAAALVSWWQGPQFDSDPHQRQRLFNFAVAGAIVGAYGLEIPADLLGWGGPAPTGARSFGDSLPLGGRTVVGGLIGGWLAVEWAKWRAKSVVPAGDGFALPLAVALAFGRMGCLSAGCCAGRVCEAAWWTTRDVNGMSRIPTQLIEVGFHGISSVLLAIAVKRNLATGRRFAIYVSFYAVLRFTLEFARENTAIALGLSWYQWLCLVLLAIAGTTWWRRTRSVTLT